MIVDQNMNGLRSFRNQALEGLFNTIIAVMLAVILGLLFFASRISNRVRGLRNQAEGIIDDSGRVRNTIVPSPDSDEIGDLSRSFSNIVERLSQYTSYLENMSSRLSHELRTPVTVVRSSIENLGSTDNPEESQVYIKRAEEGISRLNLILTNMSEATRLEQMLQTSEKETIDVAEVVKGCVEGYRLAYPLAQFSLDIGGYPIFVKGVPEYIAQLLDKLIANAVEFSHPGQPIVVNCRIVRDQAVIRISNAGPYLPQEMKDRVFESMVSVRPPPEAAAAASRHGPAYRPPHHRLPQRPDPRRQPRRRRRRDDYRLDSAVLPVSGFDPSPPDGDSRCAGPENRLMGRCSIRGRCVLLRGMLRPRRGRCRGFRGACVPGCGPGRSCAGYGS